MNQTNPIRILIVDDHKVVRIGLTTMINEQPAMVVIADADSGQTALETFRQHRPDITIMDLRMPGMSGVEAMLSIRQEFPEARFIVLSTYDGDADIYRAFKAGAMSYVLKDALTEQLLEAIKVVHGGRRYVPAEVAVRLAEHVPLSDLTPRELDVLKLAAKGRGNKEIAAALNISENTVKFFFKTIMSKLEAHDRTQAVTVALQRGIIHLD